MIPIPFCERCDRHTGQCPCHTRLPPLAQRRLAAQVAARHRDAVDRARLSELYRDARRRAA